MEEILNKIYSKQLEQDSRFDRVEKDIEHHIKRTNILETGQKIAFWVIPTILGVGSILIAIAVGLKG